MVCTYLGIVMGNHGGPEGFSTLRCDSTYSIIATKGQKTLKKKKITAHAPGKNK